MAKSLGMIHSVNVSETVSNVGDKILIDLPGQLTNQLQRMVRAAQYFKVVGIDIGVTDIAGPAATIMVEGTLNYYAPTRGRCNALKNAYEAVRRGMKLQGVNIHGNRQYDFRVPIGLTTNYVNGVTFLNQATIDGTNMLTLDASAASATDEVFTVYNANIQPSQTAVVNFNEGFGLPGAPGAPTDFVLNEGEYYEGSLIHAAELEKEQIPFQVSFGDDGTTASVTNFNWRPDPALYLAVLTGQFELEVNTIMDSAGGNFATLEIAVHVSGWKSVLGSGKKRRRRSKKGKKSHGRKRHSKR